MPLRFSKFIFSTGIKLFIRPPVVLFGILILSEQFDGFVQPLPWCIVKNRQLCLRKYLKYWFYIRLLLRKNELRYKIRHWLELGCFCKWKQPKIREIYPMECLWCRIWLYLTLSIFTQIWCILRLTTMSPCKGDTLIFVDNKG